MTSRIKKAYYTAMGGYFALFTLLMIWNIWLSPAHGIPKSLALLFFVGPLLFPLRGMLHGRPYSFAVVSFIALIYILHGTVETYSNPDVRGLAILESIFSLMLFFGSAFFARWRGMELKALSE